MLLDALLDGSAPTSSSSPSTTADQSHQSRFSAIPISSQLISTHFRVRMAISVIIELCCYLIFIIFSDPSESELRWSQYGRSKLAARIDRLHRQVLLGIHLGDPRASMEPIPIHLQLRSYLPQLRS
ncbi:hypothetical protein F2Q68_00026071 [Brassica cretica]|uniref:Uncharacterized protein n=1 Tax=Brassica cretica TaxID=69181 RepID=A0A8S9IA07_BRACR|nr:hypothetical protein F2Q68_00026071 [Brassica cretica]